MMLIIKMDKQKVKNYFSKKNTVYCWWDLHKSDKKKIYKRQEEIIEKIIKLKSIKKFLDVSCGKGRYVKKLFGYVKEYTCLDISQQMLDHVKKLGLNVKLVKGDSEKIPLKEKFDGILCSESIVHYPNPEKALSEMKRVLGVIN